jgi:hypothetical protein
MEGTRLVGDYDGGFHPHVNCVNRGVRDERRKIRGQNIPCCSLPKESGWVMSRPFFYHNVAHAI